MSYLIREVTPQEFVEYYGEPSRDRLARFVLAPVTFPRGFFFACREGNSTPIARIGVSKSVLLEGGQHGAAVGFFSGNTDAMGDLLRHVDHWSEANGVSKILGPMIYNTWFPYRAKIYNQLVNQNGDGQVDYPWEPHQPRGDEKAWENHGYQIVETYATRALNGLSEFTSRQLPALELSIEQGFSAHSFSSLMGKPTDRIRLLNDLFDLTMESFKGAFLFLPISREQFHQLYVAGLSEIRDLSMSFLIRSKDGRPAAFSFAFPEGRYIVIKTLAVGEEFRGKKLSNAAMALSCQVALSQGLDKMIHALMRRGNLSENFGGKSELLWEHRYALFAKEPKFR
jgi:hypothetical protein